MISKTLRFGYAENPFHSKYRKHLLKVGDSFAHSHLEFAKYDISEIEGISLLGGMRNPLGRLGHPM